MKKDLEGRRALISGVRAGDGYAQRVCRGVSGSPVCEAGDVDADFLAWPACLVNIRKPFREANALFAYERGDAHDPAAVGASMRRPEMRAAGGGRGFPAPPKLRGQGAGAELSPSAAALNASLGIHALRSQLRKAR